jgi:hypothetical protein
MKRITTLIFALFITSSTLFAQNTTETFAKGDNVLGVGIGVGGVYGIGSYSTQTPVLGVQYDRGIVELKMGGVIGAGAFVGYKNYVYKFGNDRVKWNIWVIGARGTFHYDLFKVENLDTYGGMMIAFHVVNEDYSENYTTIGRRNYNSAAYASLMAGAKYYFAPNVAGYAEIGYGVSWLTMGVAFKL